MRIAALIALLRLSGAAPSQARAALRSDRAQVTYWSQGRTAGPAKKWTLRCAPAGGTLPQAASACRRLAAMRNPFAPIPRDAMCTELYGGPQVALITGTFRGRALRTQLARRNGCEISRFDRLSFLVPG